MRKEEHVHTYDQEGNMTCCSLEEKIDAKTPPILITNEEHHEKEGLVQSHSHEGVGDWNDYLPAIFSLILLVLGLLAEFVLTGSFFTGWIKIAWYALAYFPVGVPVLKEAWKSLLKGEIFTEFFLMSIATIGAFAIGEYPEGVAVMLFYAVGELFQTAAVRRAKGSIKALLDVRPKTASVLREHVYIDSAPENVLVGETIQVKVGEKIPLDGTLLSDKAILNAAALTGESKPKSELVGAKVLAGSINLDGVITIKVDKLFDDSSIARILELVQNATARKSKTELLIRRLAKIYTPIVVYLALAICFLPFFLVPDYLFSTWLYRALIFLVISCPCALVISIPLGYFGGLGAASRNGLLFKGATYLDQITKVNALVMDKTGTITKGVFKIKDVMTFGSLSESEFMNLLMALERKSTHPIAKAILEYPLDQPLLEAFNVREIAGKGLSGKIGQKTIIAGNEKLLQQFGISIPPEAEAVIDPIVLVGINGQFAGYVTIADELKDDIAQTISGLQREGVQYLAILSGDKDSITKEVGKDLNVTYAKGGLLPEDKLQELEMIKKDGYKKVAFVGDGINDAPVLAASDIGIAMGALGSDVAIETADVIIQTDEPSKIITALKIGKSTQRIIWQNIYLAFGVKILVLVGGALGMATMWQAVFADVGVALLAIFNAMRLQGMEFDI